MTITATIIADSISLEGSRLTTMSLRYPRFIHAEFMTHRVFSRNASSSRAIPVERMIRDVMEDPATPVHWGANQKGMQASEECDNLVFLNDEEKKPEAAWRWARIQAIQAARAFSEAGYHKQVVNRLLEPFGHISVVVTATEWDNFFALRCHPDAEPNIQVLARAIRQEMDHSHPRTLRPGHWHLPYLTADEAVSLWGTCTPRELALISAARCARVSYLNHDGSSPDVDKDLALAHTLEASGHMSPFEHQAYASSDPRDGWGNFKGWAQFRKQLEATGT